jgi:late competence protein required for DNA uptake (superfamily II DNA/RNA helicase)
MSMLPYQSVLYKALQENKRIWIKKARGIGITTFFLYYISWLCLTQLQPGDRVCCVVGPRLEAAQDWLDRFKALISRKYPGLFDKDKSTIAMLNKVKLEIFPSHHISAMRGMDRVRFIMVDEADYFPPGQQKEVRAVVEGYIGKPNSDSQIVFSSTPAAPQGLMQQIELEQNSLYYKCFFTYEYGLEGPQPIYSIEQIRQAER